MSNNISSGQKNYKYFVGYLYDDYKIKPFLMMFPKTNTYVKSYGETKWIYFLIEDLLNKYNCIWDNSQRYC